MSSTSQKATQNQNFICPLISILGFPAPEAVNPMLTIKQCNYKQPLLFPVTQPLHRILKIKKVFGDLPGVRLLAAIPESDVYAVWCSPAVEAPLGGTSADPTPKHSLEDMIKLPKK